MTNLVGWVGAAKRAIGLRHMHALLGVYRLTGHLPVMVEKSIYMLARLDALPNEPADEERAEDGLVELTQRLHGIIYGSGTAPADSDVVFDRSEADR